MFDDDVNFLFNPEFGPLNLPRLRWIATEHATMMRYVPLGWLACCGVASIDGLNPFWFHLAAVLLHISACLTLYAVLVRLVPILGQCDSTLLPLSRTLNLLPLVLAAWWGWHLLRVETVAWVTTLIYLLATLLGLLSLLIFVDTLGRRENRSGALVGSLLLFVAALLSHPAAISFLPLFAAFRIHDQERLASLVAARP